MVLVPLLKSSELRDYLPWLSGIFGSKQQFHPDFLIWKWTSCVYLFRTAGQEREQRLVVWFVEC